MVVYVDHIKELSDKTIKAGSTVKCGEMIAVVKTGMRGFLIGIVIRTGGKFKTQFSSFQLEFENPIPISCTIKIKT